MATDIYSRTVNYGGAFSADGAVITFGTMTQGMLAQSINWSYVQNVQRIYEVGSNYVYLVAGRTQGQAQINRIMGPTALATAFYSTFGDVCQAWKNSITFAAIARCGTTGSGISSQTVSITLGNCVIQSYGGGIQAEQMVVNEQIQLMYLSLAYG